MKISRIVVLLLILLMVSGPSVFAGGQKDADASYPARDITVIIPHGAGGGTDTTTRVLAKVIEKYVDVSLVCENRTGGGGAVGMGSLSASDNDGYTIGVPTVEVSMLSHLGRAPFTIEDFAPVALITNIPSVIAVHSNSPFKTFGDLIDYARKNPGEIKAGNSGIGAIWHFVALGIADASGVEFTHVPFDGGAPAATALLGEHIDLITIGQSEVYPFYESGDFRALAVTSENQLSNYPGVPTLKELGVDLPALGGWQSWAFPAGTDPEIVRYMSELIEKAINDEEFQAYLSKTGLTNDFLSPQDTVAYWKAQNNFFKDLIEKLDM